MKKNELYRLVGILFLLISFPYTFSQDGDGTLPPSFGYEMDTKNYSQPYLTPINFDLEQLKREDAITNKAGMPFRVSYHIPVNLDLEKITTKKTLPNKQKIWQKSIVSPNANGLILIFDRMQIPEGGRLYFYTADRSQVVGAYTHETNPTGGWFSTPILFQDEVVMEYVPANNTSEKPDIHLKYASYVYSVKRTEQMKAADSFSCMINVNCGEGDNWQIQKKGVVRLEVTFSSGTYYCSGSLINNVKQDRTPYILTADHCVVDHDVMPKDTMIGSVLKIDFNYEKAGCTSIASYPSPINRMVGADFLLSSSLDGGSDGALLRLKQPIPENWSVYYNGWDASGTASYNGVSIHHPNGYVKTISTYNTQLTDSPTGLDIDGIIAAPRAHWRVKWAATTNGQSVTAGGSSGSPIFLGTNKLIIGTLTGGGSYCSSPNSPDFYGKMQYHFEGDTNPMRRMKRFLDPDNTGAKVLLGAEKPVSINTHQAEEDFLLIFFSENSSVLNLNAKQLLTQVIVYDIAGQTIASAHDLFASALTLPSQNWAKGVYTIVAKTEKGMISKKILK